MAVITEGQRLEEVKARLEMMTNNETLTEDEKRDLTEHKAVRDRLMRRLTRKKVSTVLEDEEGVVTIDTRLMNAGERKRYLQHNKDLSNASGDADKYNAAMLGLKTLVADLCTTHGYDRDYWIGDESSDDVVVTILLTNFNGAGKVVQEDVARFRP